MVIEYELVISRLSSIENFKKAGQNRDYATIISAARKIPESVRWEDPKLSMWFNQAVTRTGETENL